MRGRGWAWTLIFAAAVFLLWAWFVLGFLEEPSVVDRVRVALLVVGLASVAAGVACAAAAAVLLVRRSKLAQKLK